MIYIHLLDIVLRACIRRFMLYIYDAGREVWHSSTHNELARNVYPPYMRLLIEHRVNKNVIPHVPHVHLIVK